MAKKIKTPLKMSPPGKSLRYEKAREDFLSEANKKNGAQREEVKGKETIFPWQDLGVSDRVFKSFNLRLAEPDFLKLKFVANRSPAKSMHAFCTQLIMAEVKRHLKGSP